MKLSIRPGQTLHRDTGGPCDEGYSYTHESWHNAGTGVVYTRDTSGRDCDGHHESGAQAWCPMTDLRAVSSLDGTEPYRPDWQHVVGHQRDHAAEAAGY